MPPCSAASASPAASAPLTTIDALPDALLRCMLVLVGRKRCHITSAVCRRWRRLVFSEPRLWRSIILCPGLLPRLAKKKDRQRWFASQHALLRRIAPLVEEAAVEVGTVIEAMGAATGKWGLADLLSALEPSSLAQLSIQGPWSLPAAAMHALGRLTGLTYLEIDSAELPGGPLLAAVGQLAALRAFDLKTDGAPQRLPHALARLSGLEQLRFNIVRTLDVGRLLDGGLSSLTSIDLTVRSDGPLIMVLPAPMGLPALRDLHVFTPVWFAVPSDEVEQMERSPLLHEVEYSADQNALFLAVEGFIGLPSEPGGFESGVHAMLPSGAALERLSLSYGNISREAVSPCARLAGLTWLELSTCDLALGALTDLLRQLPRLAVLRLHRFSTPLPAELARLSTAAPALRELSLQHNELRDLPDRIDLTGRLHTLDLSNNRLVRLPPVLASATTLTSLLLGGNPGLKISMDDVRRTLAAMPALASLTVRRPALTPGAAQHIRRVLPGLAVVEEAKSGPPAYQPPPRSQASSSSDGDEL